jgi:hypothetical protein
MRVIDALLGNPKEVANLIRLLVALMKNHQNIT